MQDDDQWARESLRDIALEGIRERRRARRWGIFFKLLIIGYLFALLWMSLRPALEWGESASTASAHTAVVEVQGPIMADSPASAARVIAGLEAAFAAPNAQGIMLAINSPGGSPVESSRIYQAIQRLRAEHPNTPVYAVAGDVMASGAYYIAAAADAIYVDGASVVGSIGVISRGFGFTEAIERLGVERRVYAAGDEKAGLDPFSPIDRADRERMQTMLDGIHEQFIQAVRQGRGDRLSGDPDALFSGRVWTGNAGIEQGLVDALGTPYSVAHEVIGAGEQVNYMPNQNVLDRALERFGMSIVRGWIQLTGPYSAY